MKIILQHLMYFYTMLLLFLILYQSNLFLLVKNIQTYNTREQKTKVAFNVIFYFYKHFKFNFMITFDKNSKHNNYR